MSKSKYRGSNRARAEIKHKAGISIKQEQA